MPLGKTKVPCRGLLHSRCSDFYGGRLAVTVCGPGAVPIFDGASKPTRACMPTASDFATSGSSFGSTVAN